MATYKTVTVDASGADYTSVIDAIDGEIVIQSDLTATAGDLIIQVQDGYADTTDVFGVTGSFTTDSTHRVIIEGASSLSGPKWDTAKARMEASSGMANALIYNDFCNDLVIRDFQIRRADNPGFDNRHVIQDLASGGTFLMERCLVVADGDPTVAVEAIHLDNSMTSKVIRDSVIYTDGAWDHAIRNGNSTVELENVTIDGFSASPTNNTTNATVLGTNTRVTNCGAIDGADWDTGSDYNLTDEVGAPSAFLGTSGIDSATLSYADAANATLTARDFSIDNTDSGYETGTTISGHPGTDIAGTTRTVAWDIGAHEASTTSEPTGDLSAVLAALSFSASATTDIEGAGELQLPILSFSAPDATFASSTPQGGDGDATLGIAAIGSVASGTYDPFDPSGDASAALGALGFTASASHSAPAVPQFAVPDTDQATGSWTVTPLWSKVDEGIASLDGVVITSDNNTAPDNADLRLSDVTDPESSSNHILRTRWNKDASGGHAINAVAELYQGIPGTGTLIATLSVTGISNTPQTSTYTLSGAEADSIIDYTDLYIRLSRQGDTGGNPNGRRSLVVDAVELETPPAPSSAQGGDGDAALLLGALGASAPDATHISPASGSLSAALGALSSAATADYEPAERVGDVSASFGALGAVGTADYTPAERSGGLTAVLAALSAAATADYDPFDPSASASATLAALSLSASGDHVSPATADLVSAFAALSFSADGDFAAEASQGGSGDAVLTLAAIALDQSGNYTPAERTAAATAALASMGFIASADYDPFDPSASATASMGALGFSGSADYDPQDPEASATAALAPLSASATADFIAPSDADLTATFSAIGFTADGTYTSSHTADASATLAALVFSAEGVTDEELVIDNPVFRSWPPDFRRRRIPNLWRGPR